MTEYVGMHFVCYHPYNSCVLFDPTISTYFFNFFSCYLLVCVTFLNIIY